MFVDSLHDNVRMLKHAKTFGPWKTLVQVSLATSLHLGQRCSNMVRHCDVLNEFSGNDVIPKCHFEIPCWMCKDLFLIQQRCFRE